MRSYRLWATALTLFAPAWTHAEKQTLGAPASVASEAAPKIDGLVDDAVWQTTPAYDSFVQQEPNQGAPATERTEVRLLFDREAIYVGLVCYDSEPQSIVATAMRRDADLNETDSVQVLFDTFNDGQNGFVFGTNPLGVEYDGQVAGEGETSGVQRRQGAAGSQRGQMSGFNPNWDGAWRVRAQRTPRGWEAEMAIPLKTLRYSSGSDRVWGFNVVRNIRRKNEQVFLALVPRGHSIHRASLAATLPGLALPRRRDLSVIPFATATSSRDFSGAQAFEDDGLDAGLDLKWGITPNLTADFTVNTDFAQVEADDEQINLTRYELFFPEKRAFFLENASVFQLGQPQQVDLFFSRRIGLSSTGIPVGIQGGARLSGKIGPTNVGLLEMQTERTLDPRTRTVVAPANNFGVLRLQQQAGRSNFGASFVNRQATGDSTGFASFNRAYGVDTTIAMGKGSKLFAFLAGTTSPAPRGSDWAGRTFYTYTSPTWGGNLGIGRVGPDFNAEAGFVPRRGYFRPETRITWNSPQFRKLRFIRRMTPHFSWNTFYALDGQRQSTAMHIHPTDFQLANGGRISFELNYTEDRPLVPFAVYSPRTGSRVVIPPGLYGWHDTQAWFVSNPSAPFFVELKWKNGDFYDGSQRGIDAKAGVRSGGKFQATVQYVREHFNLPGGKFDTELLPVRVSWSFSPRLSLQALVQYNSASSQVSSNVRLAWLLRSGTGLFVVYNDRRDTSTLTPQEALGRSFIIKFSRLVDF